MTSTLPSSDALSITIISFEILDEALSIEWRRF
jgi:hypothetical protein